MGSRGALAGDAQGKGSLAALLSGTDTALLCVMESSEEDPGTDKAFQKSNYETIKIWWLCNALFIQTCVVQM